MSEKNQIKTAPNSKESEMMVLGCMLTSVNGMNVAADQLMEFDFYYKEHQQIFKVLRGAYLSDKPADIHLVAEELKRLDQLEDVGGVSYLTTLAQYVGTSAYVEEYVDLVKNKSLLRKMISASEKIQRDALDEPKDVHKTLDNAQSLFFNISQALNTGQAKEIKDILSGIRSTSKLPYLKELQQRQETYHEKGESGINITGEPTHYTDLDRMINGLGASNLIIVAGRPAMGKTAFAVNIAENVCFKNKTPVAIFSLEMSAEQLLHRIICSQAEVESDKLRTGSLSGADFQRIVSTVKRMQEHTMIIDDQPGLKVTDLRARARRLKEVYNIGLIIVDYLQLLSGSSSNSGSDSSRQSEISEISRMLKNTARELNVPIICASQLSRKVEERPGHRPMMSDLRESGCLSGDTLIKDADTGHLYTIKELAERKKQTPFRVFALDKDLKITPHVMSKVFYSGKKKIFELKTKSGRSIKASGNHPFYKLNGWTALDEMKVGDRIGIPRSLNTDAKHSPLDKNELVFLGHILGDGCILPNQPYHYTSADMENLETVSDVTKQLFGIQTRLVKQGNWHHAYFPSPVHTTHNICNPITTWFEKLNIERVRSYEKKSPLSVFSCNLEDRLLFLKHLWATDGNISSKKIKGRKPACSIYYASSSIALASEVQHLLLTTGIQSSLRHSISKKGYRTMYHVSVEGSTNQKSFLEKVGCHGERGKKIPLFLTDLNQIQPNPNTDTIPNDVWPLFVKPAKERAQIGWRQVCEGLNTAYCGSSLFKSGVSRQRLSTLSKFLKDETLKTLSESDIFWDEICSITELGTEDVYDATVPGVHNFVANDLIVHNSIEQDSDLVVFLLRRDYYDPYDKPGLAEVIVAKNRHGKVGSVELAYRKEFTQFANYTPASSEESDSAFAAFTPN